jgi:proteasome lid subunit RPN8/RPN11
MIVYTDQVLSDIGVHISSFEPERGGALLGIPFSNVVCRFVPDPEAYTSGSVYQPSEKLQDRVQQEELKQGLQFFGIVHSHPGGFSQPSSQDRVAFLNSLNVNPHLAAFVAPIITMDRSAVQEQSNEISLTPRGRLTSYVAYRPKRAVEIEKNKWLRRSREAPNLEHLFQKYVHGDKETVSVVPMDCSVMPIDAHIACVTRNLATGETPVHRTSGFISLAGSSFHTETLRGDGFDVILMFPPTYPFTKPALLFTNSTGKPSETRELEFNWSSLAAHDQVLWNAVAKSLVDAIEHSRVGLPVSHA